MNDFEFLYLKKRADFGRYCAFDDLPPTVKSIPQDAAIAEKFRARRSVNSTLCNAPAMSSHRVNTARVITIARGMTHVEGAWPKEIDPTEAQDTTKWRKRLEKDPHFSQTVKQLCGVMGAVTESNSTIDLFEIYFDGEEAEDLVETLSAKTVSIFRDQSEDRRSVTKLAWHPEGPSKIAATYSNLRFQSSQPDDGVMSSYIWDTNEPNEPLSELSSLTPLVSVQFSHKNPDMLAAGQINGQVSVFDQRKGSRPVGTSTVACSHYDPVYDLAFVQSKTGTEIATVSTDGYLKFWDIRDLSEPLDECLITDGNKERPRTLGGTCLEFMQDAGPTKFLVGTELGYSVSCQKKPKKAVEVNAWYGIEEKGGLNPHYGPVKALRRNPFHVKYFATVGDWNAKLWIEEMKSPLILFRPPYQSYLSDCAWSPTRPGVLYIARGDGFMDILDVGYRLNEVALSFKVGPAPLTCLAVENSGALVATGADDGSLSIMQVCDSLVQPFNNEKNIVGNIFDRETKREKNLELLRRANASTQPKKKDGADEDGEAVDEAAFQEREKAFYESVSVQ